MALWRSEGWHITSSEKGEATVTNCLAYFGTELILFVKRTIVNSIVSFIKDVEAK
jgi:hypothetical protein